MYFGQIYIEPGITFPFSAEFQRTLGKAITALVSPSAKFEDRFGTDWSVMIRISAKTGIAANDIRGPTTFKKSKDVEFSVFLPFDLISKTADPLKAALVYLLEGASWSLASLDIDVSKLDAASQELIEAVREDAEMFTSEK